VAGTRVSRVRWNFMVSIGETGELMGCKMERGKRNK
jgi:hypothetical protein